MDREAEIKQMKELLSEFHEVDKMPFWIDFFVNSILGWPLFFYSVYSGNLLAFVIGAYFVYRGTMLIHEVSHLAKKIPGYRLAYNIVFGWPNCYPAYIYDTHLFHHGKRTYGTPRDPEYKYIEDYGLKTIVNPLISSLLLPIMQLFRFGLLPFIEIFLPRKQKLKLYESLSTLAFSLDYKRPIRNEDKAINEMLRNDITCALIKVAFLGGFVTGLLPLKLIAYWYAMFVFCSLLNMYRAVFNHLYANSTEEPLSWADHLLDTATIEPSILTNLVFVNGLNYHAIHHLFPELPYTKLAAAHKKLMDNLPEGHIYKVNTFKSISELVSFNLSKKRLEKLEFNY